MQRENLKELIIGDGVFAEVSRRVLSEGGIFCFKAKGWSMFPAIKSGDVISVEPLKGTELKLGDVIFCRTLQGQMVVHRLIQKRCSSGEWIFTIKGDNNTGSGENVRIKDIWGRVAAIKRNHKFISFNKGLCGLMNKIYAGISPVTRILFRLTEKFLLQLQAIKAYRLLLKKIFKGTISYTWEQPQGKQMTLFARAKEEIIGEVAINNLSQEESGYQGWWIFGMWVSLRFRGLGIGEALVQKACEWALKKGSREAMLLVFEDNVPAVTLYKKMGFSRIAIPEVDKRLREEAEENGQYKIIMKKKLVGN